MTGGKLSQCGVMDDLLAQGITRLFTFDRCFFLLRIYGVLVKSRPDPKNSKVSVCWPKGLIKDSHRYPSGASD
ncbi:hypothetical protein P7H25_17175 [Paenibacillus larvae]|nr:hypothetical protein [Paenibacillus larvae]MDT2256973.1 hypothetical protein [Paenibacillus larvae]